VNRAVLRACSRCLFSIVVVTALYLPPTLAQPEEHTAENPDPLEPAEPTAADRAHGAISFGVNAAAQWVDSFFDDPRYIAEDASTKLRISQAGFLEQGESMEYKTRANVSIDIPRFENRVRLFAAGEEDEQETSSTPSGSIQDSTNDPTVGVQYFAKSTKKLNVSLTAGVKVDSAELFIGPRLRRTVRLDAWQLAFTQRVRWFTEKGWEATTRFDFERLLSENLFFRHSIDGRWREEDEGYRYEIRPTLIQRLASKKALEYRWNNLFKTRPNHRLEESVVSIRFRRNIWRKWLFYEIDPQIAFRNDDDFDPEPGITFLVEIVFGGKDLKKQLEKTLGQTGSLEDAANPTL
jgi:hypothetical protein